MAVSDADFEELTERFNALKKTMDTLLINLLQPTLDVPGTLDFGGSVGRLWREGIAFRSSDSGNALAAIPTGAGLNWYRDSFEGVPIGEIGGGYSTPSTSLFHNMAVRTFANSSGANAKIGVWDEATGDWLRAITVQDSNDASDLVAIFSTSGGQASTTQYAVFTFGASDCYLSLLRGGSLMPVALATGITNQTGTYSAVVGDFVRCSGTFTVTLPSAPANNSEVWVKNAGTGTITVARGGSDTMFVFTSGLTTVTLAPGEALGFKYYATGTEWSVF